MDASHPREQQKAPQEGRTSQEPQYKSYARDSFRQNRIPHGSASRPIRARLEETVDDIKADVARIEKEIDLEIKEIRSLKLGL